MNRGILMAVTTFDTKILVSHLQNQKGRRNEKGRKKRKRKEDRYK